MRTDAAVCLGSRGWPETGNRYSSWFLSSHQHLIDWFRNWSTFLGSRPSCPSSNTRLARRTRPCGWPRYGQSGPGNSEYPMRNWRNGAWQAFENRLWGDPCWYVLDGLYHYWLNR
jgi:hypothetical protein